MKKIKKEIKKIIEGYLFDNINDTTLNKIKNDINNYTTKEGLDCDISVIGSDNELNVDIIYDGNIMNFIVKGK